jgi:hypothetical protein
MAEDNKDRLCYLGYFVYRDESLSFAVRCYVATTVLLIEWSCAGYWGD